MKYTKTKVKYYTKMMSEMYYKEQWNVLKGTMNIILKGTVKYHT